MVLHRLVALVSALFFLTSFPALAQNQPASPPAASPPAASGDQLLKPEELDALVAPIALYPDNLLSLVLMASTYPLEVVQADRWASANKNLKGDELKAGVDKQGWDESIESLVATPDVLSMMSTKLDWTQKLGDAVLAQQQDVMDAVQRLRAKADANNKLTNTKQQKVTKSEQAGKQYIAIEPTDPETVYVPYYDPGVVYGGWPYPAYPPYYFAYPGYIAGGVIATGLAFGAGYALGRWTSGGNYWGGNVNWTNNNINVNRPQVNPLGGNNWQHNASHRQGVRYNNSNVANKFGGNRGAGVQNRMDFRGQGQASLGDRGGSRPGAGGAGTQRPGAGAGAGQRPSAKPGGGGQRPSAGQRPSGGQRPSAGQRPAGGRGGGNALGGAGGGGRAASMASARGHASMGGGGARGGGGGAARMGGGGGGGRGGGGGGGGGRGGGGGGGGRRSDIALKHDIVLLGHLDNGLGFYRFSYHGSDKTYVGVMAQEVQRVMPDAVTRGSDGYLWVFYDKLGVKFQTYEHWIASGAHVPAAIPVSP